MSAITLLDDLRGARESYERHPVGRDESSKFWKGLVNRWNSALATARKFSTEKPMIDQPVEQPTTLPATGPQPVPRQIDWSKVEVLGERLEHFGETLDRIAEKMQGKTPSPGTGAISPASAAGSVGGAFATIGSRLLKILPAIGLQGTAWGTGLTIALQAIGMLGSAAPIGGTPTAGVITGGLIGTALSSIGALLNRVFKTPAAKTDTAT